MHIKDFLVQACVRRFVLFTILVMLILLVISTWSLHSRLRVVLKKIDVINYRLEKIDDSLDKKTESLRELNVKFSDLVERVEKLESMQQVQ